MRACPSLGSTRESGAVSSGPDFRNCRIARLERQAISNELEIYRASESQPQSPRGFWSLRSLRLLVEFIAAQIPIQLYGRPSTRKPPFACMSAMYGCTKRMDETANFASRSFAGLRSANRAIRLRQQQHQRPAAVAFPGAGDRAASAECAGAAVVLVAAAADRAG
jgi:hypothetical protein